MFCFIFSVSIYKIKFWCRSFDHHLMCVGGILLGYRRLCEVGFFWMIEQIVVRPFSLKMVAISNLKRLIMLVSFLLVGLWFIVWLTVFQIFLARLSPWLSWVSRIKLYELEFCADVNVAHDLIQYNVKDSGLNLMLFQSSKVFIDC